MPFVGRERELAAAGRGMGAGARRSRRCELVTVVGDAGLGKSRLVAEALGSIDARVVRGRCLPYGAGITYWPVVEVVKQLARCLPIRRQRRRSARCSARPLEGTSAEEIGWAFRKLLEEQAPLVVVFDDIQWGEETFLDLVEHVALLSSGAPILLFCMARPELLDSRPTWPVTMRLEPLSSEDAASLIGTRRGRGAAREDRGRGRRQSALHRRDARRWRSGQVARSWCRRRLKALLAARLDQLDPAERRVLERGSVEGEVFHRGAVQALTPEEPQVTPGSLRSCGGS